MKVSAVFSIFVVSVILFSKSVATELNDGPLLISDNQIEEIVLARIAVTNESVENVLGMLDGIMKSSFSNENRRIQFLLITSSPTNQTPLLTFQGENIPLLTLLDVIAQASGLGYRFESESSVVFSDFIKQLSGYVDNSGSVRTPIDSDLMTTEATNMVYRQWRILPSNQHSEQKRKIDGEKWKQFFEPYGICWPAGSDVKYYSELGILSVRNTLPNLLLLDDTIRTLDKEHP